jgi:carboxypeptidase C (cathepsin A)
MALILPAILSFASVLASPQQQGPPQGFPGDQPPGGAQGRRQRPGGATTTETPAGQTTPPAPMIEVRTSVTHHTISLPGGPVTYTATAEQIPLRSDTGEVECRMFCVSYSKDGADAHQRPVTFAFNGGPGSATLWLHMGALGPKRAPMNDDGTLPAPPYEAVDNLDTWLDFTDVVVIDAPGTGFSRLARPDLASRYFGVRPDIAAFTEFVKNWLTSHKRWRSPLFVAGESYGGIRGSGLSNSLFQAGIALNGFVSISGTSNFMTLDGMRGNDSTYIGFLPSMAACAWYHHKLGKRFTDPGAVVKEVQTWIDKEYAGALERGDSLSEAEKDHVAEKLSEYLGISKEYCLGSNLRITERQFFRELLRKEGLMIGRYDGRLVGKEELKVGDRGSGDPSDDATTAPFTTSLNDYLETDLGITTEIPYLNSGNVRPWTEPEGSYSETASELRTVLARNQHFRVLYCCGYFDLACPLNATMYTVNHMGLDSESRSHVSFQYFPAGHMMYIEKFSRHKLHEDVKAFEANCLSGK